MVCFYAIIPSHMAVRLYHYGVPNVRFEGNLKAI
jgi:hypothetical protein